MVEIIRLVTDAFAGLTVIAFVYVACVMMGA